MSERLVYIGPDQLEAVNLLDALANMGPVLQHLVKQKELTNLVNVESIVYSTLIQCGVEKFEIPEGYSSKLVPPFPWKEKLRKSSYLDARITYFSPRELEETYAHVRRIFDAFLPKGFRDDIEFVDVKSLETFLIDLLIAAKRGGSCVRLYAPLNMAKIEEQIPPELLFPVRNLINTFESANPALPYPKSLIKSQDLTRFEQLINSDLFSNYIAEHERLEQTSFSRKHAIKGIIASGRNVFQNNLDLLRLKQMTISVLPLTTKVIDLMFGKLPGALADYSANLMTKLLMDEKRIIVYHLDSFFVEFFYPAITAICRVALEGTKDESLIKVIENDMERKKEAEKKRRNSS